MKTQQPISIKNLVSAMYKADAVHGKSALAVLKAYNAFLAEVLKAPMTVKAQAEVCELITQTYRSMEAEGKAKISMFKNAYIIAHGKEATRHTPAQQAQGFPAVQAVIDKCATMTDLKRQLPHAKLAKHGSTNKPKLPKAKQTAKQQIKAGVLTPEELKKATRPEAFKAMLALLKAFEVEFLHLANAKDLPVIEEVNKLVGLLKAA
jgi:hypothetical protein